MMRLILVNKKDVLEKPKEAHNIWSTILSSNSQDKVAYLLNSLICFLYSIDETID